MASFSPVDLPENVKIIADRKVQPYAVVGANETGYHLTGVNPDDFTAEYVDIREAQKAKSHQMGESKLELYRGIESHFQTRYTLPASMGADVLTKTVVQFDHHGLLRNRCQPSSFSRYGATCRLFVNKTQKGSTVTLGT